MHLLHELTWVKIYLNLLLDNGQVIGRLNKVQLTTLLFITYYLKGRNYTPSELLRKINFTDTDYEKHIYDKLINLNDFGNYLDVYKNNNGYNNHGYFCKYTFVYLEQQELWYNLSEKKTEKNYRTW